MTTWCNPLDWMGPIFDKELRVASRRTRTYWLRVLYVMALVFSLVPIWINLAQNADWSALNSLSISDEAIEITTWLILFQFIALQILAAIFLSSSISEEITRRTLGTLWTTPLRGFEVVAGKLASKTFILIQMLAISLPFLMMLRMFGGIPWSLIVGGCALALATVILVGSLSLYLSVYFRKPYVVLIWVLLILFLIFGLIPAVVGICLEIMWPSGVLLHLLESVSLLTNPYHCMLNFLESLSWGRVPFPWGSFSIQIGMGFLLLFFASRAVRKRGLRAMSELPRREEFHPERYHPKAVFLFRPWFAHMLIKRWLGPGMIWKESISPFFRSRHRMFYMVLMAIGIGVVLWTLIVLTVYDMWKIIDTNIQMVIVSFGFALGVLLTAITSVTVITSEIEGRSWPILLTTPLSNLHILGGKFYGIFRRCGWVWAALVFWGVVSCWQGTLQWRTVLEWIPLIFLTAGFVMLMGIYLALRCKRATPAITICLASLLLLWIVFPLIVQYSENLIYAIPDWVDQSDSLFVGVMVWLFGSVLQLETILSACFEGIQCCNPLFFFLFTIKGDFFEYMDLYDWYNRKHLPMYIITLIVLYAFLGFILQMRARKMMRQRVFG